MKNLAKQATKSQAEKDDEQAERMSRPAPSNKPPRKDLRRNRVDVDDKDVENQGADNDRDLSLNYKRVARLVHSEATASLGPTVTITRGWENPQGCT